MTRSHPYREAPRASLWSAFAADGFSTQDLTRTMPASLRPGAKVVSAGSCFASNLVPYLERHGFDYVREEYTHPFYGRIASESLAYAKFSAGYGNIYTPRQLLQLLRRCTGQWKPVEDRWVEPDKVVDPFRPGLRYPAQNHREFDLLTSQHLRAVRRAFEGAEVFVFTLGLTEAWVSTLDGAVFPACPGTVAGQYDPTRHQFANFTFGEVRADLVEALAELRRINSQVEVILTVSPVPLVATADGGHVLTATTYSKSVLRAVAEEVVRSTERVSYFPAYEIVTGPQAPWDFFLEDRRSVSPAAVDAVMAAFFAQTGTSTPISKSDVSRTEAALYALGARIVELECEEAFADPGAQTKPPRAKEPARAQPGASPDPTPALPGRADSFAHQTPNHRDVKGSALINAAAGPSSRNAATAGLPGQPPLLDSILKEASAHYGRQDWLAALGCLKMAIELAPKDSRIHSALGSLQYHLKDYAAAGASLRTAVGMSPNDPDLQIQLAMVHLQLNRPELAEVALGRALELRPNDLTTLKLLADSRRDHGRYQEAALIYGKLIPQHPNQVAILLSLAKCLFCLGDRDGTRAALEGALEIDPGNAIARDNLNALKPKARETLAVLGATPDLQGLPVLEQVRIENTNLCGFKCEFCPREKMTRTKGVQSVDDFKLVLDRVEEYCGMFAGETHLHGYGDPLLDAHLPEKMRSCATRWPKSEIGLISTLGYKVSPGYLRGLVEGGLGRIIVSFYGSDRQSYLRLTGVDRFEEAYRNLLALNELGREGSNRLKITVQTSLNGLAATLGQPSEHEFHKALSDLGLEVTSFPLHNYGNGRAYAKGQGLLCDRAIRRHLLQVTWDLNVVPCCLDYNASVVFGNLRSESVQEIFEKAISREFLANHRSGKAGLYDICRNCSMRTMPHTNLKS